MKIKEEIGKRIYAARKDKGLTRKALAELTDDLKPSRINNWEHGIRTPGPEEIKQLAKALEVSAAYLMCLTHQKELPTQQNAQGLITLVPLLNASQASDPIPVIESIKNEEYADALTFTPLSTEFSSNLSQYAFTLKMQDESMIPELRRNDILIVDPKQSPQPGCFVVAKIEGNSDVIVRRFKQITASQCNLQFELLAENQHWGDVKHNERTMLVGKVIGVVRALT